jgi:hypothetical protein
MRELEVLICNIDGLKELLRIAWKDLANPSLTPFERREARNQINQYSVELRRDLELVHAERIRSRTSAQPGETQSSRFIPRSLDSTKRALTR